MSQTEANLQSISRTVKRLKQMREKEMQLCNQLEAICQRQCKAQRRNQDLLRDYKRIEQELACLAAKTNHFRINQGNYMKQSQSILPTHYECFAPSSCTVSHVKQAYNANNNNMPANCGDFAVPRHFIEYPDHFCQAARNHKLFPDHLIGPQALHQEVPPNFINEEQKHSLGSICKLQHPPSVLTSLKHEEDHENNTFNKGVRKLGTQQVHQMSPRGQSSEQNMMFESFMEIHNTNCPIEKGSCLEGKHVNNCDEKEMKGKSEEDKEKEVFISNKNGQMAQTSHKSFEEIRVEHSSNVGQIGEDVPQPITKPLSYQIAFSKSAKDGNADILRGAVDGLFEENNDSENTSDSIDIMCLKGEKKHKLKNHKTIETEMLSRQKYFGNYQNPKERNDQSDSPEKKRSVESNSGWLVCGTSVEMKEREEVSGEDLAKPSTMPKENGENETEGNIWEGNESEKEELENNKLMEILQEKLLKTRIKKSREIKNSLPYGEATEVNSNIEKQDDEESISEKYSGLKMPNALEVNGGEIKDTKESKVHESDTEKTDDDDDEDDDEDEQDDEESISEKYSGLKLPKIVAVNDGEIKDTKESKVLESDSENTDDDNDDEDEQDDESISEMYSGLKLPKMVAVNDGRIKDTKESKVHESDNENTDDDDDNEDEDEQDDEESISEKYSGLKMVSTVAVKDGDIKDTKESKVHESENMDDDEGDDDNQDDDDDPDDDDDDDEEENRGRTGDRIQKKGLNGEISSIDAYDNEVLSEEEESRNQLSSGEQSRCEDQDEEDIDLSEKEEHDDLLACGDNQSEPEVDKLSKNLSLKKRSRNGVLQTSSRKGSAHLGEQASIEGLKEDEKTYTENERSFWLCCLKSCSVSQTCNKSKESQKRCSEDMTMDLLQLNPVESGSSFPDKELSASPALSRNTEVASVLKAPSQGSSEELSENGEKAENLHHSWSDSEDDVHSFYD